MENARNKVLFFLVFFIFALWSLDLNAELRAGAASTDITPSVEKYKVTLGGYGARKAKPAKGVHDPIFAKALVLQSEQAKVAIAVLDLVEISNELKDAVVKKLRGTGIDSSNLLMSATHTHSAPGAIEKNIIASIVFGRYSPEVLDFIAERTASAIKEANEHLKPAVLSIAQEEVKGITRNRRVPSYNYDTRRFSTTYDPEKPEGLTDDTLTVIRVDDTSGSPIAILFHIATHATVLGSDNFLISSDWPGSARREIEKQYQNTVVMYMNGAQGDQAPDMPPNPDDFACMELIGKKVADKVIALSNQTKELNPEPLKVKLVQREISAKAKAMGIPVPKFLAKHWFPKMPLMAVRVGEIIFLAAPLEMISEIGWTIKEGARGFGYNYPVVVGLANDHFLYCTTAEEYKKGGYEADSTIYGELEAGLVVGELMFLSRELK